MMAPRPVTPGPETVALTSKDAASDFRCGVPELDTFFHQYATQNQRRDSSRTWVLRRSASTPKPPAVLGFYTLTLGSVAREEFPPASAKRLPNYPVPIILLGRLATDERVRGQGYGQRLLRDAHLRALSINKEGGGVAVVVDAKNERAAALYTTNGYAPLERQAEGAWPRRLFLPAATIRNALETSSPERRQ